MLERLLATINANQEKADAHQAKMQERMDANTKAMQESQETTARMDAKIRSMRDELKRAIKDINFGLEETLARQETMEARLEKEKPASVDTTPEMAHGQEVPVEDAEICTVAEPRKRRRDGRNLAAVRRQKKKGRVLDARCRGKEQERAQRKNV
jgi:hypothetical protein